MGAGAPPVLCPAPGAPRKWEPSPDVPTRVCAAGLNRNSVVRPKIVSGVMEPEPRSHFAPKVVPMNMSVGQENPKEEDCTILSGLRTISHLCAVVVAGIKSTYVLHTIHKNEIQIDSN